MKTELEKEQEFYANARDSLNNWRNFLESRLVHNAGLHNLICVNLTGAMGHTTSEAELYITGEITGKQIEGMQKEGIKIISITPDIEILGRNNVKVSLLNPSAE